MEQNEFESHSHKLIISKLVASAISDGIFPVSWFVFVVSLDEANTLSWLPPICKENTI